MLAKPFTRDGMIRILRKHLTRMLKDPSSAGPLSDDMSQTVAGAGPGPPTSNQGGGGGGYGPAGMAMAGNPQVKFEHTPIQSPSTASSWHSPGQMHQTSPSLDGGGYMSAAVGGPGAGMVLTPGGSQQQQQQQQQRQQQPPHQQQHPHQHPHHQQHHPQQQQQQPGQYANYMAAQVGGPQSGMGRMGPEGHMVGGGGDDRPEKRQRLYGHGPGQGGYVQ